MTHTIDNLLVKLAFERTELEQISTRKYWYSAICALSCMTLTATWFAIQAWI